MTNKILLGLGLMIVATASVSFSDASRYVYHLYQNSDMYQSTRGAVRTVSNRIAPYSNTGNRTYRSQYNNYSSNCYNNCQAGISRHPSGVRNAYRYLPGYQGTNPLNRNAYLKNRYQYDGHPGNDVRIENTFQTNRLVVRNGHYKEVRNYHPNSNQPARRTSNSGSQVGMDTAYTFSQYGFSADRNGVFRSRNTSTAFRVHRVGQVPCSQANFGQCAQSLTQNFVNAQNLQGISHQAGSQRINQTNYLDRGYYPTVVESFDGIKNGRSYSYFILTAMDPTSRNVVRIEAVAPSGDRAGANHYMHQVFESFRFNLPR